MKAPTPQVNPRGGGNRNKIEIEIKLTPQNENSKGSALAADPKNPQKETLMNMKIIKKSFLSKTDIRFEISVIFGKDIN